MIFGKTVLAAALVAGFVPLPLSQASAAPYPCNPVTGVFGAAATVVGAAVTIGTAPLVILSGNQPRFNDYTCGPHRRYYRPTGEVTYDGPPQGYYDGPPAAYDAPPPPAYYGRPHRPRWYARHGYAAPPPPPPGY